MKRKNISTDSDEQDDIAEVKQKRRKITENFEVLTYGSFIFQVSESEAKGHFHTSLMLHVQFLTSEQNAILHYKSYTALKNLLKSNCNRSTLEYFDKEKQSFLELICCAWIVSDSLGQYNEALILLDKAIQILQNIGERKAAKAFCHFSKGRLLSTFEGKRVEYTKSIDLFPTVFCLNNRAFMWQQHSGVENNFENAYNDFSRALELYPTYQSALQNRSLLLRIMNQESLALEDELKAQQVYSF